MADVLEHFNLFHDALVLNVQNDYQLVLDARKAIPADHNSIAGKIAIGTMVNAFNRWWSHIVRANLTSSLVFPRTDIFMSRTSTSLAPS